MSGARSRIMSGAVNVFETPDAIGFAPGVHWIGALAPSLRTCDIILKTANGTSYNS